MASKHLKQVQDSLPDKAPANMNNFVETLYKKVPQEDIELVSPSLLATTAQKHWKMMQKRKTGEIKIDIYTPPLESEHDTVGHTIVNITMDDMAFLVDSVAAKITSDYKLIHLLMHPILHVKRDKAGNLISVYTDQQDDTEPESHMHIQLQGTVPEKMIPKLKQDLLKVLNDVDCATRDWLEMRDKLRESQKALSLAPASYNDLEIEEYLYFLEYLYRDNFTLLGYREYKFTEKNKKVSSKTVKGSSLGLLHDDVEPVYINEADNELPQALQKLRRELPPVTVAKVNKLSTVHRPVPLDAIAVKQFDEKGKVVGECLFVGLFTSVTYSRSIHDVPLLRHKAEAVLQMSGFRPGSHDHKALKHILEKYPRDELFQIELKPLLKITLSILRLQERQRIALYMRPDPFGRYISCLVYVPRDRYDTDLRLDFKDILETELNGKCTNFLTSLDDSPLARVMYSIEISQLDPPQYKSSKIEALLQEAGRVWGERLSAALLDHKVDEVQVASLVQKYGQAFPFSYRDHYSPKNAVHDINKIEDVLDNGRIALDLYQDAECEDDQVRLKIFTSGNPMTLSEILPILEHMGFHVLSELPFEIKPFEAKHSVWIHDFLMTSEAARQGRLKIDKIKDNFEQALEKIWYGDVENDSLNALVQNEGVTWRDVMILRSYVRYMRQMRYPLGTRYIESTLKKHAGIAQELIKLFTARHDPAQQKNSEKAAAACRTAIDAALEKVDSLDEDRIIRSITNLMEQTVRTNFYQPDENGEPKTYVSLKLNSRAIEGLPAPKPFREIFVYSRRMEGVHLRGDIIARGGIRWSDRHEDFRTEILGLMKAQQVKNSVIVPMGAKGGFIVKQPPTEGGRDAFLKEGIECYKLLVRGLLDITDNRKGKKVVPPKNVVRHEGDDPYLVVAADKGTATFSDIANGISLEYSHWLGDAFASGGSAGYDHKKMGITARGAWESVKRHFRELGHDTQKEPFDIVGVGDMAGDVFGNGMLLSKHIKLVGAFNHIHIVCDPDPDPESSFAERRRLFKAVKGWDAYDTKKLSKGGRIFLRTEKSLKLTPQIMERFGIETDRCTPAELIRAMLKSETDLLWFGGIGTYVKAKSESHADVGDKNNDPLRVNASELRAKVIGEGANLAVTQKARIEYGMAGGKVNADFIDNSGGVDSSDNEVNIKILLSEVMNDQKHKMTLAKRNILLESMTDEVASLVLRHNYQQVQGISMTELYAPQYLGIHSVLMRILEKNAGLDRELEALPNDEEIEQRRGADKGLTRPELGVLHAYSKIMFTKEILDTEIPDGTEIQDHWLIPYFPEPLQKKYRKEILSHRLGREIIATMMASSLVNRMGPAFIQVQSEKTAMSVADVIRAYTIVRDSFDLKPLWDKIEALDNKVDAYVQLHAMNDICKMVRRETTWFLTRLGRPLDIEKDTKDFKKCVNEIKGFIMSVVNEGQMEKIKTREEAALNNGLPKDLARQIAIIPALSSSCDIIKISLEQKTDLRLTAQTYFELGSIFHFDWLRVQARGLEPDDRWSAEAINGTIEQLYACQSGLTIRILNDMKKEIKGGNKTKLKGLARKWVETHTNEAAQLEYLFSEIKRSAVVDLPILIIAEQRIRNLYGGN